MTISKKLQKILALTLMTSFLSTSCVMGVSEAAAARPNGGGRPQAQSQQIRPETRKGPSGHQMKAPMQKSSGHQARPAVHKSAPAQRMQPMHKGSPGHQAKPMMQKSGSIRHGGSIHHGGPVMHKGGPNHRAQPMAHKGGSIRRGGSIHHGGPVIHRSGPVIHHPAPYPSHHHHHDDYRSMHSGDWIGALVIGGIIGAIIANNSHRANHPDYVEYVE